MAHVARGGRSATSGPTTLVTADTIERLGFFHGGVRGLGDRLVGPWWERALILLIPVALLLALLAIWALASGVALLLATLGVFGLL